MASVNCEAGQVAEIRIRDGRSRTGAVSKPKIPSHIESLANQARRLPPEFGADVLGCVESCRSVGLHRNKRTKRLDLVFQDRRCLHVYFYYIDREFGWLHVRLQTWFPFAIQVCLNGREWLGQKMRRAGMALQQQDNCFIDIADPKKAQRWMDQFQNRRWARWLDRRAQRTMPWLSSPEGSKLHGYYWTVRQAEFATDVMFRDAKSLDGVYPTMLRHAMENFRSPQVLRFLGRRCLIRGECKTRLEKRREGVCVKHFRQENWIKMYNKQGSVLRIETTINNPRRFKVWRRVTRHGRSTNIWTPLRKGISRLPPPRANLLGGQSPLSGSTELCGAPPNRSTNLGPRQQALYPRRPALPRLAADQSRGQPQTRPPARRPFRHRRDSQPRPASGLARSPTIRRASARLEESRAGFACLRPMACYRGFGALTSIGSLSRVRP